MNRCDPVEMRKNLEVVETFKKYGIDFVAVPVMDSDHKNKLIAEGNEALEAISKGSTGQ
jgi:hypothetical protein